MNLVRVVEDPEIYLLRVPFPHKPHKKTNIYIAVKGGECLLIDVGCGGDAPFAFVEAALESLGFANAPLNVFLTHLHPDHAGLLPYLAQAHRASVIMGEESYRSLMLARKAGCFEGKGWEYLRQNSLPPSDIAAIKEADLAPTVLFDTASVQAIADRDMLERAGCMLQAVSLRGHAPGHMGLHEKSSNVLFSGDHLLFDVSPALQSSFIPQNGLDLYIEDLHKICSMAPTLLLHAHGELLNDYVERAQWLICHQTERKLEVLKVIRKNPNLTGMEVAQRLRWNTPTQNLRSLPLYLRVCVLETAMVCINQLVHDKLVSRVFSASEGSFRYLPS